MTGNENARTLLVLRHGGREHALQSGEWFIGRDADCVLRLDDPLISRRHAVLRVREDGSTITDLSSANGVYVNGAPAVGATRLSAGSRILVGREELLVVRLGAARATPVSDKEDVLHRVTRDSFRSMAVTREEPPTSAPAATTKVDTFALISTVLDRMLAERRAPDAERLLTPHIEALIHDVNRGKPVPDSVSSRAAEYSIKVAEAGGSGKWLDHVLSIYSGLRRPLPRDLAASFLRVAGRVSGFDPARVRGYVEAMRADRGHLSLESRETLERLESAFLRGR